MNSATTIVQCKQIPAPQEQEKLGMYGPEDLALDTSNGRPRLIVSSHDRRHPNSLGKIFQVNLETNLVTELDREDEPKLLGNDFRPHGINLQRIDNETYLYVVVHGKRGWFSQAQWIVRYFVREDHLKYDEQFGMKEDTTLLTRPNDVQGIGRDSFYVTNLSSSAIDPIIYWHTAPALHFADNQWATVEPFKGNGNGIIVINDQVLIADDRTDQIIAIPLSGLPSEPHIFASISVPDNINYGPDDDILIASHDSGVKLALHGLLRTQSGGSIVRAKLTGNPPLIHKLFMTDGAPLSTPSSAVYHHGTLYVGQVYDPFILSVPITNLEGTYSCQK